MLEKEVSTLVSEKSTLAIELGEVRQELHRMKIDFVEFGSRNLSLGKENIKALSIIARLKLHFGDERVKTMDAEQKV